PNCMSQTKVDQATKIPNRLLSIDILRGFDMLMIILADHFFYNLNLGIQSPITEKLAQQFSHPQWFGLHFYDIIMPLFLFVGGVVIPASMDNRIKQAPSKASLDPHIIRRFVILFILGWIVQGNLLAFDLDKFHVYSNTLQAIAVGYLFCCIADVHLGKNGRYALFGACLLVYALILEFAHVPGMGQSVLL